MAISTNLIDFVVDSLGCLEKLDASLYKAKGESLETLDIIRLEVFLQMAQGCFHADLQCAHGCAGCGVGCWVWLQRETSWSQGCLRSLVLRIDDQGHIGLDELVKLLPCSLVMHVSAVNQPPEFRMTHSLFEQLIGVFKFLHVRG